MNSVISGFLYLFGAILFFAAGYYLYEGIIEPFQPHNQFSNEDKFQLAGGIASLIFSIGFIWAGALLETICGLYDEVKGIRKSLNDVQSQAIENHTELTEPVV